MAERKRNPKRGQAVIKPSEQKQNSIGKNLLGAIAGALLGFIFWLLIAYFVGGNLHVAVAYIMAACVFYGCFIFTKDEPKGFNGIYIAVTAIFALLGYFSAQAIVYLAQVINAYGWDASIGTYFKLFFPALEVSFQGFFLQITEFVIMLIVLLVGLVQFISNKSRLLADWAEEEQEELPPTEEGFVEDALHDEMIDEAEAHSDAMVEQAEEMQDELCEFNEEDLDNHKGE